MKISLLYKKVEEFEKSLSFKDKLFCKEACSRCCYTDISVFELEAAFIRDWFEGLEASLQDKLIEQWSLPLSQNLDFSDNLTTSCVFLSNERCSIYDARPLICRTQGLPFKFGMNKEVFYDVCPLNEQSLNEATEAELLNLDLLNTILVQLEKEDSHSSNRARVKLSDLKEEFMKKGK